MHWVYNVMKIYKWYFIARICIVNSMFPYLRDEEVIEVFNRLTTRATRKRLT